MARLYIFGDETGDFHFVPKPHASKYFIVCTVAMESCRVGAQLLRLRREMLFDGLPVGEMFHASEDKQAIRDKVFELLSDADFTIQATIMEKRKSVPRIRPTEERFYHYGWFYHFKWCGHKIATSGADVLITTAKVKQQAKQAAFTHAVTDSLQQCARLHSAITHFCPSSHDPCLQVVDYCAWAIFRKWESGRRNAYDIIRHKITHEADMFAKGNNYYY